MVAGITIVLEITKQILNVLEGFEVWALPFHYCSLFVFFFPLAQFCKGKLKSFIKPVSFACSLTVFFAFYLSPGSIIGSASSHIFRDFSSFHTFVFHHLVFLYVCLSIALDDYKPRVDDYKNVFVIMACYCVCGVSLSYVFDTNYNNFLYSVIDFVDKWRVCIGQIPYIVGVSVVVILGTTLMDYLYFLLYCKFKKKY